MRPDGEIAGASASERTGPFFETVRFLVHHFTTVRLAYDVWLMSSFNYSASLARPRARWAFDPALQEAWGRRGLKLAAANLDRIVALCLGWNCRLTLVVYPWPDNVVARDEDSLQVTYWRDWAAGRNVRFVDGFAPFFREPATDTLRKYFIAGDIHFTTAGHRLLFDTVRQDAAASWR